MTANESTRVSTPESMTSPTLATRYGAPKRALPPRRRRWLITAAVAVGVIVIAVLALVVARPTITTKDVGFAVRDATAITVDIDVTVPDGVRGRCAVQALDERFTVVGYTEIDVTPAGEGGGTAHRVPLRTTSLAVSGGVDRCWNLP